MEFEKNVENVENQSNPEHVKFFQQPSWIMICSQFKNEFLEQHSDLETINVCRNLFEEEIDGREILDTIRNGNAITIRFFEVFFFFKEIHRHKPFYTTLYTLNFVNGIIGKLIECGHMYSVGNENQRNELCEDLRKYIIKMLFECVLKLGADDVPVPDEDKIKEILYTHVNPNFENFVMSLVELNNCVKYFYDCSPSYKLRYDNICSKTVAAFQKDYQNHGPTGIFMKFFSIFFNAPGECLKKLSDKFATGFFENNI